MTARFLELEITGACHHRCLHCYGSFPRKGSLDRQTVKRLIDEARGNFDCIIFSGGEPFLHPDLEFFTRYADDFVVFITTAGYRVTAEQIHGLPGNVVLVFGIDGIGEVHDRYRGTPGAYEELIRLLMQTRERPKEIITTLWKGVLPQIDAMIELAEAHGAILHFNALIPVGRTRSNTEILLARDEQEVVYQRLQELRLNREASLATDLYKVTERDREGIDLFCKGRYSVSPAGDVRPCEFNPAVLGSIFRESLSEIMERAGRHPFMQAREQGFKDQARHALDNPFDYHTEICHALSAQHPFCTETKEAG
jgi:MoaA/NifB/PqqE/SkfB family radical SAM enzyme